jgi:hypothetical protein
VKKTKVVVMLGEGDLARHKMFVMNECPHSGDMLEIDQMKFGPFTVTISERRVYAHDPQGVTSQQEADALTAAGWMK